jgi:diadenosine tetraphosphate (Ap4A) HIT family hydrolase
MTEEQECLTCRLNEGEGRAPGGVIYQDGLWRLEHAIEPIPMAGWLVLKPLRHVEHFADLTPEEAAVFGPLTRQITQAMREVLRPEKIYLSLYAEAVGFAHLHVHIIPRFAGTPDDRRGPRVFDYLRESSQTGRNLADVQEAVRVAAAIRHLLEPSAQGR